MNKQNLIRASFKEGKTKVNITLRVKDQYRQELLPINTFINNIKQNKYNITKSSQGKALYYTLKHININPKLSNEEIKQLIITDTEREPTKKHYILFNNFLNNIYYYTGKANQAQRIDQAQRVTKYTLLKNLYKYKYNLNIHLLMEHLREKEQGQLIKLYKIININKDLKHFNLTYYTITPNNEYIKKQALINNNNYIFINEAKDTLIINELNNIN